MVYQWDRATETITDYIFLGSEMIVEAQVGMGNGSQNTNNTNVGYTGHQWDNATGLNYMQARYYDPLLARFYSNDPIGFRDIYSFNRYAYANNNPYKYFDPDGRNPAMERRVKAVAGAAARILGASKKRVKLIKAKFTIASESASKFEWQGALETILETQGVELHRPYIRKKVRETVEAKAPKTKDGKFIDPNTGKPIEGKYDLGHKRGSEFRREKVKAEAEGLSQEEFNNKMNDPKLYQVENPSSNRSHKYEKK
jgi:RHS repeat-associated protein